MHPFLPPFTLFPYYIHKIVTEKGLFSVKFRTSDYWYSLCELGIENVSPISIVEK